MPSTGHPAIVALLAAASLCLGQEQSEAPKPDPRIDEDGREVAYWPPDRPFDHLHMRLELTIPDMQSANLSAVETLRITPIGTARSELRLSAKKQDISSVTLIAGGQRTPCEFRADRPDLFITLPRAIALGETVELEFIYTLDFSGDKGEGLTWSKGRDSARSETRKFPQIHSQGEADENSRWFICHDFPNDRLTTELIVNIEDGYEVLSNGRLVDRRADGGRARWHWLQDKPHVNYLVTLVVGKFAVVEIGGPDTARPGLPMPVYVDKGREENVRKIFARTPDMVTFFEKIYDEPYPWDKYAQACVRDFAAGGMENTSATSLYDSVAVSADADQDDLIAHELAHQWFGDLLTCDGWEHLWLNEGWASFSEALWREDLARKANEDPTRAYQRAVLSSVRAQRNNNRASAPRTPAMVTNRYSDPDKLFSRTDDVYSKGTVILHMLRQRLGAETFLAAARHYINENKERGLVDTDDFRRAVEEVSGESLERFFEQWVLRPGLAQLKIDLEHIEADGLLKVSVTQAQTIDYLNPAYAFTLPIRITHADGSVQWESIDIDTREASAEFRVKAKPEQVTVDPNVTVFARTEVTKPLAMWINELEAPPTLFAAVDAAEALASIDSDAARLALARAAARADVPPEVRLVAAESLLRSRIASTARRWILALRNASPVRSFALGEGATR
jgi:aminopeptidase N